MRANCERRRAIGSDESVESPDAAFAEWHGYARIDAQLQTPGQSGVSRSDIRGRRAPGVGEGLSKTP
jgi:hypothetical protein